MSNPAVIILKSVNLKNGVNFRIEDNIGECVHIHYGNFRIDISIEELLSFEDMLMDAVAQIIDVDDFNIEDYDIQFLADIADRLKDLESVAKETVKLDDLIVANYWFDVSYYSKLNKSMMYRALTGDAKDYAKYEQENWFGETNLERLKRVENFVNSSKEIKSIVLFNRQNNIRDGQHRASVYLLNHKTEIEAIRLSFKNSKHNMSAHPVLAYFFTFSGIKHICGNMYRLLLKIKN